MNPIESVVPFSMAIRLGKVAMREKPAPVLNQSISQEAGRRTYVVRFIENPRLSVGRQEMHDIETLLAVKVHFGIVLLVVGLRHRVDLGQGIWELVVKDGDWFVWIARSPSSGCTLSVIGRRLFDESEALIKLPSTDK